MKYFIIGFLVGAVLLDFLWAYRLGLVSLFWTEMMQKIRPIIRKFTN